MNSGFLENEAVIPTRLRISVAFNDVDIKVKLSRYRPEQVLGDPIG
jgi:hypothetical protein